MRKIEHELSTTHYPKNGNGAALRWDYNPHNGRRLDSNSFSRDHGGMKPNGIHWATQAQLIRRGGLFGYKKIKQEEVDGFIQALRTSDIDSADGGN